MERIKVLSAQIAGDTGAAPVPASGSIELLWLLTAFHGFMHCLDLRASVLYSQDSLKIQQQVRCCAGSTRCHESMRGSPTPPR